MQVDKKTRPFPMTNLNILLQMSPFYTSGQCINTLTSAESKGKATTKKSGQYYVYNGKFKGEEKLLKTK